MKQTLVIAHRGASGYAPENTMAAFRKALDIGVDGIELDVHLTKDGHLVVNHDPTVERTSNGIGLIMDQTLDQLKGLDFGSWFSDEFSKERIPTLEEVLDLITEWDGLLNIEIKADPNLYIQGIESKLAEVLKRYNRVEHTIISSFNHYCMVEMKKFLPEIKTGLLYGSVIYRPWNYISEVSANAIHPYYRSLLPEVVEGCHKNGISVNCWTVNNPKDMETVVSLGVDGIITNYPDVAIDIMKGMS